MPTTALLLLLAKATVVLVAALALDRTLRRASAGARHLVWLAALGALVLVPALAVWAPLRVLPAGTAVSIAAASNTAAAITAAAGTAVSPTPVPNAPVAAVPASAVPAPAVPAAAVPAAVSPAPAVTVPPVSASAVLAALWSLVTLGVVGSLVRAWLLVRGIVRRATPLTSDDWCAPLYEVADRLALDEPPRLLRSAETNMPFACGLRRPTVVLPAQSDDWAPARRRAVLLHELAHVRRRDLAGHTLAQLVCAAYWFHPLVWSAARRLRAESERACDDLALSCGARASDYAEHLLDIVAAVRRDTTPHAALAMARRSEFEGRMLDILDPERARAVPGRRQAASLVGALALVTLLVGAAAPVASRKAEPKTPASAPIVQIAQLSHSTAAAATTPRVAAEARPSLDVPSAPRDTIGSVRAAAPVDVADTVDTAPVTVRSAVQRAVTSLDVGEVMRRALAGRASQPAVDDDDERRAAALASVLRSDTSASLRRVAAWGLAEHSRGSTATTALVAAVRGDASASVREMAAWALAQSRGGAAVDALGTAARGDADAQVRVSALWALVSAGDRTSAGVVTSALADPNAEVRFAAAWALGSMGAREAPRALVALLGDADPKVRKVTAWALYTIEDPTTVSALQSAFRAEREPSLRAAYVRALASLGDRSVDALSDMLTTGDAETRAAAVRALAGGQASGPWPWPWPRPRPFP